MADELFRRYCPHTSWGFSSLVFGPIYLTDMGREEFENLIQTLITLGEDRAELEYWKKIYDFLSEEDKRKLENRLGKELQELNNLIDV